MQLTEFRVQNYKKIRDTGWVSCGNLTVFVGKNEAGKSAVFRGLSKLNPSDGEPYDGLKEFPRRRYTDEFKKQDWPAASAKFSLSDSEKAELHGVCPELGDVQQLTCTRHYSGHLAVGYDAPAQNEPLTRGDYANALRQIQSNVRRIKAPEGKGGDLKPIKDAVLETVQEQAKQQGARPSTEAVPTAEVETVLNHVSGQANEDWQQECLRSMVDSLENLMSKASIGDRLGAANEWVEQNIPQFVYFDRYDVVDSAVHMPTFAQQLGDLTAPKVRTTRCLFEHVGLDVDRLASLGRHKTEDPGKDEIRRLVDERAIHFSSASNAMTNKFQEWYEQRRHRFRYQADGDYFRVWVSDDLDPSEIELDQRSQGLQYFFSFYTVFLVEAQDAHQNSILLLDEPGLHMHGTAQAKIVTFLDKLAVDNQTLYSTHSPFMIDGDRLERARVVYEHEDGTTKVSEDVWPRDKDSLFPLQAALGYQLTQSLFVAKRQLIVEGLTDMWLIKALDQAMVSKGKPRLRDDVIVVPAAGVTRLLPLASMLTGHDVEIVALLDGDEPGRREGKKVSVRRSPARCLGTGPGG